MQKRMYKKVIFKLVVGNVKSRTKYIENEGKDEKAEKDENEEIDRKGKKGRK